MSHVYVIQFSTGGVKVGQSRSPDRRIEAHRDGGRAYGTEVTATWVSPKHQNVDENERELIAFCRQHWSRVRAEYFPAADFELVSEFAKTLTFEPFVSEPAPKIVDPPIVANDIRPIHAPDGSRWDRDHVPVGGGWHFPRSYFSPEVLRAWDEEDARLRAERIAANAASWAEFHRKRNAAAETGSDGLSQAS
jgi:hypothetical protein